MADVALAWVLSKGACPIVGLNSVERVEAVSRALGVKLEAGGGRVAGGVV